MIRPWMNKEAYCMQPRFYQRDSSAQKGYADRMAQQTGCTPELWKWS